MKKLFSFVLVAVAALCVATNVYAMGGEGKFNLKSEDFASFRDLYNYVNTLDIRGEDYYTTGSWSAYTYVKAGADLVVVTNGLVDPATNTAYTDAELESFKANLLAGVNGLTPVTDYSLLNEEIARYNTLNGQLYTAESFGNATVEYETAASVAARVDQPKEAYQETVNRAYFRLRDALNNLEVVNNTSEELIKHHEIVNDQHENGTYTEESYYGYTDTVKDVVEYLGGTYAEDQTEADYTSINAITNGNNVDVEYAHQLFEARAKLVRVNGTTPVVRPNTNVADLPPIPNTADAVVSYIIMMIMGIAGITIFGKKLASSK